MKKTYETPSMTVIPIDHQCVLSSPSGGDGDKTPGVQEISMDSMEQPHNG